MTENKQQRFILIASFSAFSALAQVFCAREKDEMSFAADARHGTQNKKAGRLGPAYKKQIGCGGWI
jgi:hypothetical protein